MGRIYCQDSGGDQVSLPVVYSDKICHECCHPYKGWAHDDDTCVECRKMRALERIADVLEYYVGNL